MPRPSSLAFRCCALALLLSGAGGAALAACDDAGTLAIPPDSGAAAHDATADVSTADSSVDAGEEPAAEASCAVDAGPLDDAQVALGQQLVGLHKCENCHGSTLSGNNDGVPSLTAEGGLAYPPNLTPDPATGLGCWTNEQIESAILDGVDNEGMPLCAPMPQFGHLGDAGLDPAQAAAVVAYLRTVYTVVNNVPSTPDCPVPPPVEAGVKDSGTEATADAGADTGPDATSSPDSGADSSAVSDGSAEAGD